MNNFIIVCCLAPDQIVGADNYPKGLITPPLVQKTNFGAYLFFALFCLFSLIWTYFFVPETNGRSLEQMDMVFKDASGEEDEARRAAIEQRIMAGGSSAAPQEA